jgi:bifunctional UDP-N-acetylglucosamine pyrophosphorylase / glucosamine-1-phosphate N-acetyltransferase
MTEKNKFLCVILAAGKGTRMKSTLPKPLCQAAGRPMVEYVLRAAQNFAEQEKLTLETALIVGHLGEEIIAALKDHSSKPIFIWQREQKGTGHALMQVAEQIDLTPYKGVIICCGDTPLLSPTQFKHLFTAYQAGHSAVVASFHLNEPYGYGRILRRKETMTIVEEKEASAEQKMITEVNAGFYLTTPDFLQSGLKHLIPSMKTEEYYLTDIFCDKKNVYVSCDRESWRYMGVNDRVQLAAAQKHLYRNRAEHFLLEGVNIIDPEQTYIGPEVQIAEGVTLFPQVWIEGKSVIGEGASIGLGCSLVDCQVGKKATIKPHSVCESSIIGEKASVGPMAHLRAGSVLEADVKIGNFVETKKSHLHRGVKVSHLSYVGDAEIGEETNIGCGFITCNYDGTNKHKTIIGKECFIGSDSQVVAPLHIGDRSFVASGSTINQDMPAGSFAISRGKQVTKEGLAERFLPKKKK